MVRRTKSKITAASADTMMSATLRSNAKFQGNNKTNAYFYGNMGDSIERRYGGGDMYGGGNDAFQGSYGAGGTWNAQGLGNYYGTGLVNGYGRMYSGVHNGSSGGGFTYLKKFSSNASFNHMLIAQCMMAYLGYGVVRNIVDLYADFATEGIEIDHPNKSVRNFYRAWAHKVNLEERVHSAFINLFSAGQFFAHRRMATLQNSEKRAMQRAEATEVINDSLIIRGRTSDTTIDGREMSFIDWFLSKKEIEVTKASKKSAPPEKAPADEDLPENDEKRIPWGYTFLNPLQMELRGRKIRGDSYWVMAVDKRDTLDIARGLGMRSSQDLGTTEFNLPKEFVSRIKAYEGPGAGYAAEIKLSSDELIVVQAPGKWDWFDWAVPFIYPCLKALSYKDCLRNMEMRACQSVINSIFLFKLGNTEKGLPADDEAVERLADMLQMPGQVMNIIWNDLISAEVLQPNIQNLFDTGKHDSADKDILTALGVPEVLLGGKGGNFSNSYIAVATVLERLESYRTKILNWIMGELKIIADVMDFKKLPTVRFGRTSLQDEKTYQTFLTSLYDRNILSADTVLKEVGTDMETEAAKLKEQKTISEKNVFEPRGPFIKDEKPKPLKSLNGRPSGTSTGPTGKQKNARPPKGRNVALLLELHETVQQRGIALLQQLEDSIGGLALQTKAKDNPNLKHLKQLRQEERDRLEQLIYNVFSHMPYPESDNTSEDFIINMLKSDAAETVKADVLNIYTNKVAEYSSQFNKPPTKELRRQFMASSWTQCAILQHLKKKSD